MSRSVYGWSWQKKKNVDKSFVFKSAFNSAKFERWERGLIKREFNTQYEPTDYDLLFLFNDYHSLLYQKCRLIMQSIVGKVNAFQFTSIILYINLIMRPEEDYDTYEISFNSDYSKGIFKYLIFENVYEELILKRWQEPYVFDWCFDEELKDTLGRE